MRTLNGVICPPTTPLTPDLSLDEAALRRLLARLRGNVDGILALGTTGEAAALSERVARHVIETTVDELGDDATIVVGIGDTSTERTLRNLDRVVAGVDLVAVCAPYYYPATSDELFDHYARIADASPVPVVLYNIPQNTHQRLDIDLVAQLARHDNIVGIKDSSGDLAYFARVAELSAPDFAVLQGTAEDHATEMFRKGVDGYVSGLENICPGILKALQAAVTANRPDAAALQEKLSRVLAIIAGPSWLPRIKAAVAILDGGSDRPVPPLRPVTAEGRETVRQALLALGLIDGPSHRH